MGIVTLMVFMRTLNCLETNSLPFPPQYQAVSRTLRSKGRIKTYGALPQDTAQLRYLPVGLSKTLLHFCMKNYCKSRFEIQMDNKAPRKAITATGCAYICLPEQCARQQSPALAQEEGSFNLNISAASSHRLQCEPRSKPRLIPASLLCTEVVIGIQKGS